MEEAVRLRAFVYKDKEGMTPNVNSNKSLLKLLLLERIVVKIWNLETALYMDLLK